MTALQIWANENVPGDEMHFKRGYWDQIMFVRDILGHLFDLAGKDEVEEFKNIAHILSPEQKARHRGPDKVIQVVSTHRSKSVVLPVFELKTERFTMRLRYNFYDWKVSYDGPLFEDVFQQLIGQKRVPAIYCEGFKEEWVFGPFDDCLREDSGRIKFTAEIYDRYELYALCRVIRKAVL